MTLTVVKVKSKMPDTNLDKENRPVALEEPTAKQTVSTNIYGRRGKSANDLSRAHGVSSPGDNTARIASTPVTIKPPNSRGRKALKDVTSSQQQPTVKSQSEESVIKPTNLRKFGTELSPVVAASNTRKRKSPEEIVSKLKEIEKTRELY